MYPTWPERPKRPNPLPGTKRYVLLSGPDLVFETDDKAEALALILSGLVGDALCDREFRVNTYCKVTPCLSNPFPNFSPPPIATIGTRPPPSE